MYPAARLVAARLLESRRRCCSPVQPHLGHRVGPQAALHQQLAPTSRPWLATYNTERHHSALGGTPPTSRRTLPGLLRFAVEAAARDRFFSRQLQTGESIVGIEDQWQSSHTTRARVTLALYGEVRTNFDSWLDQHPGRKRRLALGIVGPGMHAGLKSDVDPQEAVAAVGRLVEDIRDAS